MKKILSVLILSVALLGNLNADTTKEQSFNQEDFNKILVQFSNLPKNEQQEFLKKIPVEQRNVLQKAFDNESSVRMLVKSVVDTKISGSFVWPGLFSVLYGTYKFFPCLFNQCALETSKNILGGSGNIILGFVLLTVANKMINKIL
ncbi:MAG: hypothetical protein ABIA74_01675 [bacterium]